MAWAAARALLLTSAGGSCAAAACWAGVAWLTSSRGVGLVVLLSLSIYMRRGSGVGCEVVNDLEGVRGLPRLRGALLCHCCLRWWATSAALFDLDFARAGGSVVCEGGGARGFVGC